MPYEINGTKYYQNADKAAEAGSNKYRAADRTLTIPYTGSAGDQLAIVVKKSGGDVYSSHTYTIPHIYEANAELAETNAPTRIIVVNKGILTITGDVTVNAIYVAPGAELVVSSNKTLTVDSIMLRTTPWKAAILDNQGTISLTTGGKAYYTRIIADNSKYYQFALPLSCDVKNVRLSNYSKCTYNTSWMLKSYEEALRADNGPVNNESVSNWEFLEPDGDGHATIVASRGYEMFSNTPYYREYYFPVNLGDVSKDKKVAVSKSENKAAGPTNAGWNALCSPLLSKYTQSPTDASERIKISKLTEEGVYSQSMPSEILPAVPFYYQAPHSGYLYFTGSEMTIANSAPRRVWNTSIKTQWLQMTIQNTLGEQLDETNLFVHPEKFVPEYESGYDVAKQSLEGGKALLYTELPCGQLAFAAVPDSLAETRIPLTVYAATEGEYIFSMKDNDFLGRLQYVFLHDTQTGLVVDLLERDCAVNLAQGTNAGRFYIQCVFAAEALEISTGVNHLNTENDKAQKIIYNNKVYIIYQGRVYDMTGRQCELR